MSRDLTAAQFQRAYEAEGFVRDLGWLRDPALGVGFGLIFTRTRNGFVPLRRESLAHAIRRREEIRAERAKGCES